MDTFATLQERVTTPGSAPSGVTAADYTKMYKYCSKAWPNVAKRDDNTLKARVESKPTGAIEIVPGQKGSQNANGNILWTGNLGTCMGLVVTGTPTKADGDSEFVAHITIPDWKTIESQFNSFANYVQASGLKDAKGWIYIVDTRTTAAEVKGDADMEEEAKVTEELYNPLFYDIASLLNGINEKSTSTFSPMQRVYHPWSSPGAITLSGKSAPDFSPKS